MGNQDALADATRWILAGASRCTFSGRSSYGHRRKPERTLVVVHVVVIGVVLLLAALGSSWPAAVVITTLAATLAAVLVSKQVVHARPGRAGSDVRH